MQCRATHELHIEVSLTDDAQRRLTNYRKRLNHEIVNVFAALQALTEFGSFALQRSIGEQFEFGLKSVDIGHQRSKCFDLFALAGTKNAI